ncbi:TonB-dependent receptor [Hephaestia mangrovi]|uniref:TonB-dependent receptor n=1 Tax=Hephaestia mangrovi TaxID=2873268 RepID=UPI001CA79218|nr:TonB-dependent receptor [Hephaestia mangrovi]MBY8829657.1 TonB-dependent receptor [Hephaestia mangrovi]
MSSVRLVSSRRSIWLSATVLATANVLLCPAAASAQTQSATTPEPVTSPAAPEADSQQPAGADIVVTGFRASLASAIQTKRNSSEIVDAINAQDIASFPDANLADSLQRIPGISIERDGGEGRDITVRGLGGNFSRTRFNGMETVSSTTGSTLGAGVNRGRGFDYSVFASELFNSIVVHKTQSANVDEGSLGATVDLQTARPFDHPGFQAAVSAQGAYYDINKSWEPRLAGLVSKTFDNDRFGILLSAAYSKRTIQEDAYSDTSLADFSDINSGFCPVVPGSMVTPVNPLVGSTPHASQCVPATGDYPGSTPDAYNTVNQPNVFVPRLPGYGRFIDRQERLGITGSVQWRPSDHSLITIDAAFSRLHQDKNDLATNPISLNRGLGSPPAGSGLDPALFAGRPNMKIRDAQVDSNGQLVYGVFDDTDFSVVNSHDISTTRFYQADIHIEQDLGDRGKLNIMYGQADSYFDNPYSRLVTFSRFDSNGFVYDARTNPKEPLLDYNFDATDPSNWSFQNGYDSIREYASTVDNRLKNLKLDLQYKLNDAITARAGVAAKRFNFISTREQRLVSNTNIPALPSGVTIGDLSSMVTINDIGLPAGSTNSFIVPNIDKIMELYGVDCLCQNQYGDWRIGSLGTGSQGDNRSVQEQDLSPYLQADFDFDFANGMTLRGNIGVRYAKTWQRSQGYVGDGVLTIAKRSYGDWLPSANFALDITPKLTARIAASKVMSRPELGYLTPGGSIGTAQTPFTATVGNPYLDPYRATNFDAGLEWYFQHGAILSFDYFHKDLSSFVQQITSTTTYAAAGLPLSLLTSNQDPNTTTNITTYENTSGGKIDGIEVQYQQPFTFLPGFLKHFGAIVNYTHIHSNISYILTTQASGPSLSAPLVDASPNAANATLYYEDSKLSARVSLAYRDEYVRQVPLRSGLADVTGAYGSTNVDASLSYKITPHVTLTMDALNLTNEATSYWDGQDRRDQQVYSKTGRQFFFGARYKF